MGKVDPDEAQGLVQETYAKALQHLSRFAWGTILKAWSKHLSAQQLSTGERIYLCEASFRYGGEFYRILPTENPLPRRKRCIGL